MIKSKIISLKRDGSLTPFAIVPHYFENARMLHNTLPNGIVNTILLVSAKENEAFQIVYIKMVNFPSH